MDLGFPKLFPPDQNVDLSFPPDLLHDPEQVTANENVVFALCTIRTIVFGGFERAIRFKIYGILSSLYFPIHYYHLKPLSSLLEGEETDPEVVLWEWCEQSAQK